VLTIQKTATIKLEENAVYRVIDGKIEKVDKPITGFGEVSIQWQDNKPHRYEVKYSRY